jgi:S-formylglutathione hydrolase
MATTRLIEAELASGLVPGPVEYAVLLPAGYEENDEAYPLLFFLHGGRGDRSFLTRMRPAIEAVWAAGTLPPVVVVTPSVSRCEYMDYRDGSQKWERFLLTEFPEHLRQSYRLRTDRQGTLLFGISMGGMGGLRVGFKYPDLFGGVAALEPGIEPALAFRDIQLRDRFWRSDKLFETIFGRPVDEAYWAANNPANIVLAGADRIRSSGLAIYLDCGDEDSFHLNEGTEFLHRILYDRKIPHEYHLVRGADHLGRTLGPRTREGLGFLGRVLSPPPPDPIVEGLRQNIRQWKTQAGLAVD